MNAKKFYWNMRAQACGGGGYRAHDACVRMMMHIRRAAVFQAESQRDFATLVEILQAHAESAEVCIQVCDSIFGLDPQFEDTDPEQVILRPHISMIVQVLGTHANDAEVCASVCGVLWRVSRPPTHKLLLRPHIP